MHVAKVLPCTLYTNQARICKRNCNANDGAVMKQMLFKPGFRIDVKDVIVILLGITGVWFVEPIDGFLASVIGLTVGHFFLFCNVFRLARRLELGWTTIFIGLCICQITMGQPGVTVTLICTLVTTGIVIASQVRSPAYHGIGWQRINPKLPDWWKTQFGPVEGRSP